MSLCGSNPKMGVAYMMDKQFIARQTADVAKFLHTRRGVSKKAIGDYLSQRCAFHMQVLK